MYNTGLGGVAGRSKDRQTDVSGALWTYSSKTAKEHLPSIYKPYKVWVLPTTITKSACARRHGWRTSSDCLNLSLIPLTCGGVPFHRCLCIT